MPLPTFLIIGSAKAGTTSLWKYCDEHPQVFMSRIKECNFFSFGDSDIDFPRGPGYFAIETLDEYRRLFDDVRNEAAIGEASPSYLRSPQAPGRIDALLPGVKIVVSLREPASRAYSRYLMYVRQGRESAGIDEAFATGSGRLWRGGYFEPLKRYYDRFGRERIHVCLFDEFSQDPAGMMVALFQFLGVDDTFRPAVERKHNAGALAKSGLVARIVAPISSRGLGQHLPDWALNVGRRLLLRPAPECPPELRERLRRTFRDDVLKTQDLIQRDLSGWLT